MKRILFSIVCICLASAAFASTDISDNNTQQCQVAKNNNLSVLRIDVNAERNEDITFLMKMAYYGQTEAVKSLLEKGEDVNARATNGATALGAAAQGGHTEVVKLLLEKGADVSVKAINGKTALWVAKSKGHTDIVQLLEKAGAKE